LGKSKPASPQKADICDRAAIGSFGPISDIVGAGLCGYSCERKSGPRFGWLVESMSDNLLDQFLTFECTPHVRKLLTNALADPSTSRLRFAFNRFEVTIEPDGGSVLIEDVLDASEAGEHRVTMQEFLRILSRCGAN
jgi:hypothetical protein